MTFEEKTRLIETPVTLNGLPALISGRAEPFATVRTLTPAGKHHIRGDWSWPTVARIVATGGNFKL